MQQSQQHEQQHDHQQQQQQQHRLSFTLSFSPCLVSPRPLHLPFAFAVARARSMYFAAPDDRGKRTSCRLVLFAHRTSHVTRHTSHVTRHTSPRFTHYINCSGRSANRRSTTPSSCWHWCWNCWCCWCCCCCCCCSVRNSQRAAAEESAFAAGDGDAGQGNIGCVFSHVTRHTSHVARHKSHITRHKSHVAPGTPIAVAAAPCPSQSSIGSLSPPPSSSNLRLHTSTLPPPPQPPP